MVSLGLGTVQLGLPYGNRVGQPLMPESEASAIMSTAVDQGIRFFDTASAYGESEERIGRFLEARPACSGVEVSTKVPAVGIEVWENQAYYCQFLHETLAQSRKKLCQEHLGLLQFHQCDEPFLASPDVSKALLDLLNSQACSAIGISVYTPSQAKLAAKMPAVSALQIPINLLEERFSTPELTDLYEERGLRVIGRSILMQGILADEAQPPPVRKQPLLTELRRMVAMVAAGCNCSLQEFALRYVFSNLREVLSIALIGVQDKDELLQSLAVIRDVGPPLPKEVLVALGDARSFAHEHGLLNPGNWN